MEKKELKFYEAPVVESVEVMTEGFLCNSIEGLQRGARLGDDFDEEEE